MEKDDNRDRLTVLIGERLRTERQRLGLSLSQLSDLTGGKLSKSRIINYEQGTRRLGIEEAQILACALDGVTPAYLLCLEEIDDQTREERRLLDLYRLGDERGKQTILTVARTASRLAVVS